MNSRVFVLCALVMWLLALDTQVIVTARPPTDDRIVVNNSSSPAAPAISANVTSLSGATVLITAQGLNPAQVTIQAGEVVSWVNQTNVTQRLVGIIRLSQLFLPLIMNNSTSSTQAASAPSGRTTVASLAAGFGGDIPAGGTYSYTFSDSGDYAFYIADHPDWRGDVAVIAQVDQSTPTSLDSAVAFLYTGPNAVQSGVAPGTIEARRVAVARGKVLTRDGAALVGVKITILNHPEYGQTLSRADGMFDLALNGGGPVTLKYERDGYLPAQRQVDVPWQDFVWLPDVVLTARDPNVTTIDLSASTPIQVARGGVIADSDGTRRATLFFPQGVAATMVFANGSTQPISLMSVRATEYTVGPGGPATMPGELPPTSGYTYATEFTVDEAEAAGAKSVRFNPPIISYLENFLNFPIGIVVPVGSYDREQNAWVPEENGRVVKILSISGGMANLDTDGDGVVDNGAALGVTDAERQQLAALYSAGQSLWRVPLAHFTQPWDSNFPYGPRPGDVPPTNSPPNDNQKPKKPSKGGDPFEIESQALTQDIPIAGTGMALHYQSDRTPGNKTSYSLLIPASGITVPVNLKRIEMEIRVTGRFYTATLSAAPNQSYLFTWDGKDAYGRTLQGRQPVQARIGYVYDAVYQQPAQFAQSFASVSGVPISGSKTRKELTFWQEYRTTIGALDMRPAAVAGWTLNVHHAYDPNSRVLLMGDGSQRSASGIASHVITRFAGGGDCGSSDCGDGGPAIAAQLCDPESVVVAADGSVYVTDYCGHRVRRIAPNGVISTVAGNGTSGYSGDNGPATQAQLNAPWGLALGPDGSLYIGDAPNNRIRRVMPNGIIITVAGIGTAGFGGDGGLATQAMLNNPFGVAVAPDGSFYISDFGNHRVRRVGVNGVITTVVTQAQISSAEQVSLGPDGSLYIADLGNNLVRRLSPAGIITTVAGGGYGGDGVPATRASLDHPVGVMVGPDSSLYIVEYIGYAGHHVRQVRPDGIITTIAGNGQACYDSSLDACGEGGPPTQASLKGPARVALAPDGTLYLAELRRNLIRKISRALPGFSTGEIAIPAEDGNVVYRFANNGRHLRTVNALTGATIYSFNYDSAGRLIQVVDSDSLVTTVERDAAGNPTAIVAPGGQRTTLGVNANGYLSQVSNPFGNTLQMNYTSDGLLTSRTDARGNPHTFTYDALGRVVRDQDAAGGIYTLARVDGAMVYTITLSTPMSRTATYRVESLSTGAQRRIETAASGTGTTALSDVDATSVITYPDGSIKRTTAAPDPRWFMQAPIAQTMSLKLPSGLQSNFVMTRTAKLADPTNPNTLLVMTNTASLNGRTGYSVLDTVGRTVTGFTPAGRRVTTQLDARGHVTLRQLNGLAPITYTYDSRGRLTQASQGGRTTTYSYDALDRITSIGDPLGRTLSYTYDAANRVTQLTLPDSRVIQYAYDANGNATSLTPPSRPAHTFNYNSVDLVSSYTAPNAGSGAATSQYAYDLDQQLTQTTRPDGSLMRRIYDSAGRLSALSHPSGTLTYTYQLTSGNLISISAPGGITLGYTYNGPYVTRVTHSGPITGQVAFGYDNDFRIITTSVNNTQTISYTYDADGFVTQAGALNLARNGAALVSGTSLGSVSTSAAYNDLAEETNYSAAYNSTSLLAYAYTRDALGRITQKSETISGVTTVYAYTYDLAGRLTQVVKDGNPSSAYTYDANGNRLTYSGPLGNASGNYDAQDGLTQYGSSTYAYTANGELRSKTNGAQTTTYTYDALGNLTAVSLPDGTLLTYAVDGLNRRIGKSVNGTRVQGFLYAGRAVIAELDAANNVVSRFVYATHTSVPSYMLKGGVTYRILSDHLGSPRLIVDVNSGTVAQRIDYDEFGNVVSDTNPGFQPFGFAGGLYDQLSKLTRFGVRDYDALTGRWAAKNPLDFVSGDMNLYAYVANDPINSRDPTGYDDEEEPLVRDTNPTYELSEEEFGQVYIRNYNRIKEFKRKGVSGIFLAKTFDSAFINDQKYKYFPPGSTKPQYKTIIFRGHKLNGGELNYYFQGLVWHEYGYSKRAMHEAIIGHKAVSYASLPSGNDLWAADAGYDYAEAFEPLGGWHDAGNVVLDFNPITFAYRLFTWPQE